MFYDIEIQVIIQNITGFDVTNNTALTDLRCSKNLLTAEGLNALFGTLHSNTGNKGIVIGGNPGTATCNRTIATTKGWKVN